jgi:hypothetical protein
LARSVIRRFIRRLVSLHQRQRHLEARVAALESLAAELTDQVVMVTAQRQMPKRWGSMHYRGARTWAALVASYKGE